MHKSAKILPGGLIRKKRFNSTPCESSLARLGSIFEIVYRRLVPRLSHNKTIGAIAHHLSQLIWIISQMIWILRKGVRYENGGPAVSEQSKRVRTLRMIRTPRKLGYRVEPQADPA